MNNLCDISVVLSHLAFIYIGSSIFYLIVTRNMESPFMDAVKLIPELIDKKIDLFSSKVNQNLNGI